jgi:unsaturated rhamnogalacturonyl hydrolase
MIMKRYFLSLSLLFSLLSLSLQAQYKTVTLDYYFNNEYKKNPDGTQERFHYIWEDKSINGYSIWGDIFKSKGYQTKSLEKAPTAENLKGTDIYIITDPDTQKESPNPNYMDPASVTAISNWVKQGGVLVMMTNDSANAELPHFNLLSEAFGIHYTDKVRNSVIKDISVGKLVVPEQHEIFKTAKVLYMKGISTITINSPATPVLEDKGDILIAKAKYGKGTVIALVDPWIYNEYIVNDRLSAEFQNGIAANEFTDWLIKQVPLSKQK